VFPTTAEQISLLEDVLNQSGEVAETADHYSRLSGGKHQHKRTAPQDLGAGAGAGGGGSGVPQAQRFTARLEELSGGHNLSYREQNKSQK
jgi:DNA excision repair protein ERCC-3